jgi:hypothetical protein
MSKLVGLGVAWRGQLNHTGFSSVDEPNETVANYLPVRYGFAEDGAKMPLLYHLSVSYLFDLAYRISSLLTLRATTRLLSRLTIGIIVQSTINMPQRYGAVPRSNISQCFFKSTKA